MGQFASLPSLDIPSQRRPILNILGRKSKEAAKRSEKGKKRSLQASNGSSNYTVDMDGKGPRLSVFSVRKGRKGDVKCLLRLRVSELNGTANGTLTISERNEKERVNCSIKSLVDGTAFSSPSHCLRNVVLDSKKMKAFFVKCAAFSKFREDILKICNV